MAATLTVTAAAAAASTGTREMLTGAAAGCFAAMLAVTFAGNMPVNLAVLRWQEPGDRARWIALRRRWDRLHSARILLDSAGFGLLVAACLSD